LAKQAHPSCAGATKESIDDLLQMSINSPFLAATLGLGTQTGSSPTSEVGLPVPEPKWVQNLPIEKGKEGLTCFAASK